MIIDLPLSLDADVLRNAADKVGVALAPIGQSRTVRPRDIGEQVTRVDSVLIRPVPGSDKYRAYSHNGRRKNAICWHGHREWMRAIFRTAPATAIRSALATYVGSDDFERTHESSRRQAERAGYCNCGD